MKKMIIGLLLFLVMTVSIISNSTVSTHYLDYEDDDYGHAVVDVEC